VYVGIRTPAVRRATYIVQKGLYARILESVPSQGQLAERWVVAQQTSKRLAAL
jgi:hypothetical protein